MTERMSKIIEKTPQSHLGNLLDYSNNRNKGIEVNFCFKELSLKTVSLRGSVIV